MKHIIFTVTNDLSYDRRMIRICSSLAGAGYGVTLAGAGKNTSPPLTVRPFMQKRIRTMFKKGFGFYAEFNMRLFFYLLFKKCDAICCIDPDTMLPVHFVSALKNKKRIYDAHEYFSQMKEVISRPGVHQVWARVEKTFIPRFKNGYTVSQSIADEFERLYKVKYETIRNVPVYKDYPETGIKEKFIIYQGAVNEARGLEFLIPAMMQVNARLFIYGDGNFAEQTKALIQQHGLSEKVIMKGMITPEELEDVTSQAYIGVNLVEHTGLNQYYSLANKFFDYIMHRIPQVTMNFPEYERVNNEYETAVLIGELNTDTVANAINSLLNDETLYKQLKDNCIPAAKVFNWENEEKKLLNLYKNIF